MISPENIRNVWAVGRNYADHAKELGNAVPTEPLLFLKAGSTITTGSVVRLPHSEFVAHHEIELALQFDQNLKISHVALALDLTDRAKQNELKAQGQPWTLAKSFKFSCPLSKTLAISSLDELKNLDIVLKINGQVQQKGNTAQMIFGLQSLVDFVLLHFPVCPGDLLLTGTPSGVGPLKKGDQLEAALGNLFTHQWTVE